MNGQFIVIADRSQNYYFRRFLDYYREYPTFKIKICYYRLRNENKRSF